MLTSQYFEDSCSINISNIELQLDNDHIQTSMQLFNIDRLDRTQLYQEIICSICLASHSAMDFMSFCSENHLFCKTCTQNVIQQGINNFKIIKCPDQTCKQELDQNSKLFQHLPISSKKKIEKVLLNRTALSNPTVKLCRKQECVGILIKTIQKLSCNICKEVYCIKCLQINHIGQCDKLVAKSLQKKYKFRKCPHCSMIVQKSEGCNHMRCLCAHQFCYKCGAFWSSQHYCQPPPNLNYLQKKKWQIQHSESGLQERFYEPSRMLSFFQPDVKRSSLRRFIHILSFSVTLYPLMFSLALISFTTIMTLYLSVGIVIILFYYILISLFQVYNLQLKPSLYLLDKGVPEWIVRLIAIPLYPVNLIFAIRYKSTFYQEKPLQTIKNWFNWIIFLGMLPFLIMVQEPQDK